MSLITLVVEEVKFVFDIDGIVQTIAILLTALFTAVAAWGAMRSAKTSERQLATSLNTADQVNFFGLLDALEKAHNIRFLTRGVLYEKLKDINGHVKFYESYTNSANQSIKQTIHHDSTKKLTNYAGEQGKSPCLFEIYFDYVKDVSLLFEFEFIIPKGSDYTVIGGIGIIIPIAVLDPDKTVYIVNTVANELLGYKDPTFYEKGIGVSRKRDFEYFNAFKYKYREQKYTEYQYFEGKA